LRASGVHRNTVILSLSKEGRAQRLSFLSPSKERQSRLEMSILIAEWPSRFDELSATGGAA
jgi:hypothetical protein